jgi:dihydroorotate dehydrogenase
MPLADALYPLVKPLLFRLEPERAHEWTAWMMRTAHRCGLLRPVTGKAGARVECLGLRWPNRAGLAAGMDKGAESAAAWAALGFGFVEVGTVTPRPQPGNPRPRLFRLPERAALINRMGFNNPGVEAAVERLRSARSTGALGECVIGVNIGKNFDTPNERAEDDYAACMRAAWPVADYIAVNISSPNTKGLRDLQAEEPVRRLLERLTIEREELGKADGRRLPLLIKIAPDLDDEQIEALTRVIGESGFDGVIATNTTIRRDLVQGHPLAGETGGLSGAPVFDHSNRVLAAFRGRLPHMPLIGVGGVCSGRDAATKRGLGADLVQVYSGLVYRGPRLLAEVATATGADEPA